MYCSKNQKCFFDSRIWIDRSIHVKSVSWIFDVTMAWSEYEHENPSIHMLPIVCLWLKRLIFWSHTNLTNLASIFPLSAAPGKFSVFGKKVTFLLNNSFVFLVPQQFFCFAPNPPPHQLHVTSWFVISLLWICKILFDNSQSNMTNSIHKNRGNYNTSIINFLTPLYHPLIMHHLWFS